MLLCAKIAICDTITRLLSKSSYKMQVAAKVS